MDLVLACGSIFVGCWTVMAGLLWWGRSYLQSQTFAVKGVVRQRGAVLRRPKRSLLRLKLLRAGYRGLGWVAVMVGSKIGAAMAGFGATWWAFEMGQPVLRALSIGAAAGIFAWLLPEWWLNHQITERTRQINHHLTDMLDLLVVCLEAGLSFNASLLRVASEMQWSSRVLSEELQFTNHEIQMGRTRPEALRNLGDRCNNEDFSNLIAVIVQAEKFGMSMAKTLRTQVEGMRQKRRQKIQQVIQTIPVKMLFPMVMFIFPNLFIVILGPALIRIVTQWKAHM